MRKAVFFLTVIIVSVAINACTKKKAEVIPPAPSAFKAEVINGNVRLSWVSPDDNFKEYSLVYLPDGVPRNIPKDSTSVTVTYLQMGKTYVFSLRSRDFDGNLSEAISVEIKVSNNDTTTVPGPDSTANEVYTGDITFSSQADIDRFAKKYHKIDGKVIISGADIVNLLPLAALDSVKGLEIYFNDSLQSFSGLNNLKYVGGTLYIRDNKLLTQVNAFSKLQVVDKDLVSLDNKKLENLDGLSQLKAVAGSVYIGIEAWKNPAKARGNSSLSNFCGLKPLLNSNGLKGELFIENNLANPSKDEILSSCP